MALVESITQERVKERNGLHAPVACTYTVFSDGAAPVLQLDTYRRGDALGEHDTKQTIQLTRDSALQLRALIDRTFA